MLSRYAELAEKDLVVYEIEIVSLQQGKNQQREELRNIRALLQASFKADYYANQIFEHEDIRGTTRAVVRTTGRLFKSLVEGAEWQTKISWFDLRPEFETFHSTLRNFNFTTLAKIPPPPADAPIICIVDSGVTAGNPFIEPVAREELFHSFLRQAPEQVTDEYGHGSGVASLAAYYSLNIAPDGENHAQAWIASARILDENNKVEEDRLFSTVLKETVEKFAKLGIRIFNLSVNNTLQRWSTENKRTVPRKSWVARTIDRLSKEHDVVFVVSSGNLSPDEVAKLVETAPYPQYFTQETTRLLDPAQAALALTVGSLAPSTLTVNPRNADAMALAKEDEPSPFTRSGPGINREIKPELVEYGGNYHWNPEGSYVFTDPGSSIMMASRQEAPSLAHDVGTSFAAPKAANKLARILGELSQSGVSHVSAVLIKALAVNSAEYPNASSYPSLKSSLLRDQWRNLVGYGVSNADRAVSCDDYNTSMFYQGNLAKDTVAFFSIPVPAILSEAKGTRKRLTITVACAPEVQRWGLEEYLGTRFKWRLFRGNVSREDVVASMSVDSEDSANSDDLDGTLAPDRPGEISCQIGVNLRSRGCIQHDTYEWTQHQPKYSSSHYTLAVTAFERWNRTNPAPVPYAVVVRLEELGRKVGIYTEIEQELIRLEAEATAEAEVET